jgi:hypothetical protein
MGRDAIQAEGRRDKHAISIITPHILSPFSETPKEIKASPSSLGLWGHDGV